MLDLKSCKLNEEDIKTKIILPWLKRRFNLTESDISFEKSFKIQAGRGVFKIDGKEQLKAISPKLDILIKESVTSKNLFIVEAKCDNHPLTNKERDQAISYARLTDPITPFTITTNGKETKLYETISKNELKFDKTIDLNNYEISLDIESYYEAIKFFIGLNKNNFVKFLKTEYSKNTETLIANSIEEEKSYYPPLFEPNPNLESKFNEFIESESQAFSLIAPSGMGKTCWMCHKAKETIEKGEFVYFLRFAEIKSSIFESIINDLNWNRIFTEHFTLQDGFNRIDKLISNKPLYIFIDGIDEGSQNDKLLIFEEFFKYAKKNYKLIVSCKTYYWKNFLEYYSAPSRLSENLFNINDNENAFLLNELTTEQLKTILKKYSTIYSYKKRIPGDLKKEFMKNAFLMKIAFDLYKENNDFLLDLSSQELILKYIEKIQKKLSDNEYDLLLDVADLIFQKNTDRISHNLIRKANLKIPRKLYELNLLAKSNSDLLNHEVEFYFSKLRDYIIAFRLENFKLKDEVYFEDYKKNLTNVRHEVLNTYFSIADEETKKKISPIAYHKAYKFCRNRIQIIEDNFPSCKNAFQPFTAGNCGIVVNVDLQTDRCTNYSYTAIENAIDSVILYPSSSADNFTSTVNKHDINTMYGCYDLNDKVHEKNIKSEIEELINENKNRIYQHSFNLSNNKQMLLERVLILTLKRYGYYVGINRNEFRPCSNYFPIKLFQVKEAIYEKFQIHEFAKNNESSIFPNSSYSYYYVDRLIKDNKYIDAFENCGIKYISKKIEANDNFKELLGHFDKEDNTLINYINILLESEIEEITEPFIPDWSNSRIPRRFSFQNYSKEHLPKIVQKLYLKFLYEYKTFIDTNFPTYKCTFPFYNYFPCKVLLIIDPQNYRTVKIISKSNKIEVECILETIPSREDNWSYSFENLKNNRTILSHIIHGGLGGILEFSSHSFGSTLPDDFDVLNRSILEQLKDDLDEYYDKIEKEKIDSFTYIEEKLSENELNIFKQICSDKLDAEKGLHNDLWSHGNRFNNDSLLKLNELNYFSITHINMLNEVRGFKLNPNSLYAYLQKYYPDFITIRLKLISRIKSLDPTSHHFSKDIAKELKVNPVIINSLFYQFDRNGLVKIHGNMNGDYWIYEINTEKLDDCL